MDTEELLIAIKQDNEQTRRHFDVVAESLKSDIRLLAEGHGVLVEKVDRLDTRMDHLETKVDRLDTRMDHLETKLDGFIVETRTNFDEVRAAIKFSYAELDRRVAHLESFVQDLSNRVQRIEARQTA
jgi:predicted RNase H-like nuclease (RuvC/YqgF family)